MKLIKILGLIALVGMTVGSLTTSISSAKSVYCSQNSTPCAGVTYGAGTKVTAGLVAPAQVGFKATKSSQEVLPTVTCQKSSLEGEITGNDGTQVLGVITSLTFLECTAGKLFNCTVTAQELPYSASDIYNVQGNGPFSLFAKAPNEQPGVLVDCPIVGLKCIYRVAETNSQNSLQAGNFTFSGGSPATLNAAQVSLKTITPNSGNCLSIKEASWDAVYTVSAPNPFFQSKDQA